MVSSFCHVFPSNVCILETIFSVFLPKYTFFQEQIVFLKVKQILHQLEGKNNMKLEIYCVRLYMFF